MDKRAIILIFFSIFSLSLQSHKAGPTKVRVNNTVGKVMKALIIDGQSNHGIWPKTTAMMKDYLEQTGMFTVDVERTAFAWVGPHNDNDPGFGKEKRLQLLDQYPIAGGKKITAVDKPV